MSRWWDDGVALARRSEAPTWMLILIIYGGWLALTWLWHGLPVWIVVPFGAWLCAWHMSLQHELIHGHPTRSERINGLLGAPPLNLWLPYTVYRDEHRCHHRDVHLTDPLEDPESTYVSAENWERTGRVMRLVHCASHTGIGRVVLGPPQTAALFWLRHVKLIGRTLRWRDALGHAIGVCLVLGWICGICHIGLAAYIVCVVYPGTALTLVRSLAEHRAAERPMDRTAVVEHAGLLGVLFLNNNLHVLHHEQPGLPWYDLPAQWRVSRRRLLGERAGPVYRGYRDVALRFAVKPHHIGPYPIVAGRTRHAEIRPEAPMLVDPPASVGAQIAV